MELRRRIEKEEEMILNYLEMKKETDTLDGCGSFWRKMEHIVSLKEGKAEKAKIKE